MLQRGLISIKCRRGTRSLSGRDQHHERLSAGSVVFPLGAGRSHACSRRILPGLTNVLFVAWISRAVIVVPEAATTVIPGPTPRTTAAARAGSASTNSSGIRWSQLLGWRNTTRSQIVGVKAARGTAAKLKAAMQWAPLESAFAEFGSNKSPCLGVYALVDDRVLCLCALGQAEYRAGCRDCERSCSKSNTHDDPTLFVLLTPRQFN